MHIGYLEDDPDQSALMKLWLGSAQHTHQHFTHVSGMLQSLGKGETYDLLLLDWMLPDGSGEDVVRWVRQNIGWDLAMVVLTAREDEPTVVGALQAGADDYVVKPPKQHELLARLNTAYRRTKPNALSVLRLGAYEIDINRHKLTLNNEPVNLTQKEFDLAIYIFQNPGKLLSRDHLLNMVWGFNADVDTRTVDTHVSRLRKKLTMDGSLGWRLTPVYGYGYRMDRLDAEETA